MFFKVFNITRVRRETCFRCSVRCLEYTLDPSLIKSQDADGVMSLVAANANGRLLAWDFFQQNFEEIRRR